MPAHYSISSTRRLSHGLHCKGIIEIMEIYACSGIRYDRAAPFYQKSNSLTITFTVSKYPSESLGELLKKLRLERGMTQKQLAEKIPVNEMTVVCWEKNLRKPRGRNIEKLRVFFQEQEMTILEMLFKTQR